MFIQLSNWIFCSKIRLSLISFTSQIASGHPFVLLIKKFNAKKLWHYSNNAYFHIYFLTNIKPKNNCRANLKKPPTPRIGLGTQPRQGDVAQT